MEESFDGIRLRSVKVEAVGDMAAGQGGRAERGDRIQVANSNREFVGSNETFTARITEHATLLAVLVALPDAPKFRRVPVALLSIGPIAEGLEIADVVGAALVAWNNMVDFDSALLRQHTTASQRPPARLKTTYRRLPGI